MALPADAIAWARPRVQNFTADYASRLVHELVELDGEPFDKVRFFGVLVTAGVLSEPEIPEGKTREEIYAKRWDSYLAPIRPFGLGFTVEEKRTQSPNEPRKIWRVSDIAYDLEIGNLTHREFMAIQLTRTQFPKITMPLRDPAKGQLDGGASVQPVRLFVNVMNKLRSAGQEAVLAHDEICQLSRCATHADEDSVVDEIARHRAGNSLPDWRTEEPSDLDILLNDLVACGYFRRPATNAHKALVPALSRWREVEALVGAVEWLDPTTDLGIEAYYERLMASPTSDEIEILRSPRSTVKLDAGEATIQSDEIRGRAEIVAGLDGGSEVYLQEPGQLVEVVSPADEIKHTDGFWQARATVALRGFVPRLN